LEETFSLTVHFKDQDIEIPGILRVSAYTHQFVLTVTGIQLVVEKDDEQNLRAFLPNDEIQKGNSIDKGLVTLIVAGLAKALE
jgi:hypothetical protein